MKGNKRYGILQVPLLAFFSGPLYRDVALRWQGVAFGYLLLLLAICWIPGVIKVHRSFASFVDAEAPLIIEQMPVITVIGGQVSIDEPQPYTIRDPETGEALAVIDTTGTITSLDQTDARILITARNAMVKKSAIETRTFSFENVERYALDQQKVYAWLDIAKGWAAPVLYPLCLLGSFAYRIVQALIYATIGLLLAKLCRCRLPFDSLLRLTVVALTPAIVVGTLLNAADIALPLAGLWFFLLALGYLLFAIRAAAGGAGTSFRFESDDSTPG